MTNSTSRRRTKRLGALILLLIVVLSGCGKPAQPSAAADYSVSPPSDDAPAAPSGTPAVLARIKITTDDAELYGDLYDNGASREFADLLPLTVSLWTPADFAKAFDLERHLSDSEERTWSYRVGGLAYWPEGPAVAIFHNGYREQTVVPVITLGQLDEGGELFGDYSGNITIALIEE